MSSDIRDILERLALVESNTSPVSTKKGLTKQQKSVPQLPALFKPKGISVLGAKTDPQHPMKGYAVGADESVEPHGNTLAETMADIEEDMISKVKKDLTHYLDKLEKKVRVDRDLKDKAVDAVERGEAEEFEEELDEDDYELTEPETVHDVEDKIDAAAAQPQQPVKTVAMEDGEMFEIHGDANRGYEIKRAGRSLPTRFPKLDHADMAIDLFRARRRAQDQSQDYIEER